MCCSGSGIFPAFVKYLKSSGAEEEELQGKLVAELEGLSTHLQANGPFLKGSQVSAGDLALGPKLYHVFTAAKTYKVISEHS